MKASPTNVLGTPLECCCRNPMTGFFRDGYCRTGPPDRGMHTVCIVATEEFLAFSSAQGNDLSTPVPEYDFPGLSDGDRWCLCVTRVGLAGGSPRARGGAIDRIPIYFGKVTGRSLRRGTSGPGGSFSAERVAPTMTILPSSFLRTVGRPFTDSHIVWAYHSPFTPIFER